LFDLIEIAIIFAFGGVSPVNSTHNQKVVGSNFVSSKILDRNGVKSTPGLISAPNSGSLYKNKKNTGSQTGRTKKVSLHLP